MREHVTLEVKGIDRMYLNVYVPQLQYATGLVSYTHRQIGKPVASNGVSNPLAAAKCSAGAWPAAAGSHAARMIKHVGQRDPFDLYGGNTARNRAHRGGDSYVHGHDESLPTWS